MALSKGVYSKDDCGTLRNKDTNNTRRSKQNEKEEMNKVTNDQVVEYFMARRKRMY